MASAIGVIFGILLVGGFIAFIISEIFENISYKRNMISVYVSDWETKMVHKRDYSKYEEKDKEIREKHKKQKDWLDSLDNERRVVHLMEGFGVYYKLGIRGDYIKDYIDGKIGKDQFDKLLNNEFESDEYEKSIKKEMLLLKKAEIRKQLLEKKIDEKSIELERLKDEYSNL